MKAIWSAILLGLAAAGCQGDGDKADTGEHDGGATDTGDGGAADGGAADGGAADTGDTGSGIPILDPGDPVFQATLAVGDAEESWDGEPGYWVFAGGESNLVSVRNDGEYMLQLTLDGDVREGGSLPVSEVVWSQGVSQSDFAFYYQGAGDGTAVFTVTGTDASGDLLWGALEGAVALTDSVGGGSATLTALDLESWPRFGSR